MKRILALILSVVLMLGIAVPAYAIGDENIDSGGGNLGNGTSTSYWNPGMDGVRVKLLPFLQSRRLQPSRLISGNFV